MLHPHTRMSRMQLPEVHLHCCHLQQVPKPLNCMCGATIFCLGTNFQSWSCKDPQWLSGSLVLQAAARHQHPCEKAISMALPMASECEALPLTCFRGSLQLVLQMSTMTAPMLQTSSNHVEVSSPYPQAARIYRSGVSKQACQVPKPSPAMELLPPAWVKHW